MSKLNAYFTYLLMDGAMAFILSMIFTASSIYQVTVAGLSALQLVLVGTTVEVAAFVFEVPTGVVADVYSRRLSVLIGIFLIGIGFLVEGSFPIFWLILLAQVLWGLGYTFTSGATQAWITDEIGEAAAGRAFLRSNQVQQVCAVFGIGAGMLIGGVRISLPLQLGGLMLIALSLLLALIMPETGFHPAPREDRNSWQHMLHTTRAGLAVVRGRPVLINILLIGFIYGLYSEGFDRLWTKHLLDNFTFPLVANLNLQPVVWMGFLRMVGLSISLLLTEVVRRRVKTDNYLSVARMLLLLTLALIVGLFGFALGNTLLIALLAYWLIYVSRDIINPLYTAWANQRLDSQVRATVLSMSGQVDAIGQIAGGPAVGLVGSLVSVRAALLTSSLILTPILALYRRGMNMPAEAAPVEAEAASPSVT